MEVEAEAGREGHGQSNGFHTRAGGRRPRSIGGGRAVGGCRWVIAVAVGVLVDSDVDDRVVDDILAGGCSDSDSHSANSTTAVDCRKQPTYSHRLTR